MPRYLPFDGEHVSEPWAILLHAARADGVDFHLNEGHRTKQRQLDLVRQLGVWSLSNRHGAAAYSPGAPHIRTGSDAHCLDVVAWLNGPTNAARAGARALARWLLRVAGLRVAFNVPGEDWHMDPLSSSALWAAAKRIRNRSALEPDEARAARELRGLRAKRVKGPRTRRRITHLSEWLLARTDTLTRLAKRDRSWRKRRRGARREEIMDLLGDDAVKRMRARRAKARRKAKRKAK